MFQGVGKQYIMRTGWMAYPFYAQYTNQNPTFLGKTWTEDNPNAKYPRLTVTKTVQNGIMRIMILCCRTTVISG